jgi:hypothetical protein
MNIHEIYWQLLATFSNLRATFPKFWQLLSNILAVFGATFLKFTSTICRGLVDIFPLTAPHPFNDASEYKTTSTSGHLMRLKLVSI